MVGKLALRAGTLVAHAFRAAARGLILCVLFLSLDSISRSQVPVAVPEPGPTEVLAPGLTYSIGDQFLWDNNLFRVPEGYSIPENLGRGYSHEDHINSAGISLNGNWAFDRQSVDILARVSHNTYARYGFLDNTSEVAHLYWDWAIGRLSGRLGANDDHELINFSYARLFAKDMVNTDGYFASGRFEINPVWALTASASKGATNHSLASFASSDGRSTLGSFGLEYTASQAMTIELQYKYTDGGYPEATAVAVETAGGFHDDTTRILLHYEPSDATLVLANVGYVQRSYASGGLEAYSGDIWHASLKWDPSAHTEIQIAAGRDLTSWVDAVNEYFINQERSLIATWNPREYLGLSLVLEWQNEDYVPHTTATVNGFLRKDRLDDQKLTLTSSPKSWLSLVAAIGLEQKYSNDASFQFKDKTASASFKISF
jgi:hypothetical protein